MSYLRLSVARGLYVCNNCASTIKRGTSYYRDEPHPIARIKRGAKVKYLCLSCVHGSNFTKTLIERGLSRPDQLELHLTSEFEANKIIVPTKVLVVDVTPRIINLLNREPELLYQIPPDQFEDLICNRLEAGGITCKKVAQATYQKDGGIDILGYPKHSVFPFFMAIQVKHHKSKADKVGPGHVRDFYGAVQLHGFNVGMIVTNTTFTPDARWFPAQRRLLMRLRDIDDIKRWLLDKYLDEFEWREIPNQIEVCPGVIVPLK